MRGRADVLDWLEERERESGLKNKTKSLEQARGGSGREIVSSFVWGSSQGQGRAGSSPACRCMLSLFPCVSEPQSPSLGNQEERKVRKVLGGGKGVLCENLGVRISLSAEDTGPHNCKCFIVMEQRNACKSVP